MSPPPVPRPCRGQAPPERGGGSVWASGWWPCSCLEGSGEQQTRHTARVTCFRGQAIPFCTAQTCWEGQDFGNNCSSAGDWSDKWCCVHAAGGREVFTRERACVSLARHRLWGEKPQATGHVCSAPSGVPEHSCAHTDAAVRRLRGPCSAHREGAPGRLQNGVPRERVAFPHTVCAPGESRVSHCTAWGSPRALRRGRCQHRFLTPSACSAAWARRFRDQGGRGASVPSPERPGPGQEGGPGGPDRP